MIYLLKMLMFNSYVKYSNQRVNICWMNPWENIRKNVAKSANPGDIKTIQVNWQLILSHCQAFACQLAPLLTSQLCFQSIS